MKNFIFIILLFWVPNLSFAQQKYIKVDLEETEYLYPAEKAYLKKTGSPLEGNYEIRINRYQTQKSSYINGLKNGKTEIYRNKKLSEIGIFQNDLREGDWKYYNPDGSIMKITHYKNGLREGEERLYKFGKIVETISYRANHKVLDK